MNKEIESVCKKHGLDFQLIENGMLITKPKDIWEGVEFLDRGVGNWPICKISHFDKNSIWYFNSSGEKFHLVKNELKPSTESAYIEQLKKEAFERFGEIKDGDRFDFTNTGHPNEKDKTIKLFYEYQWAYYKDVDKLQYHGWDIYKQGKWATRVNERVKVPNEVIHAISDWIGNDDNFSMDKWKKLEGRCSDDKAKFLASKLEEYLNQD